jgi:hypothetical protein
MITPIITGATRRATKGLKKILETIPRKHPTDTLIKTRQLHQKHHTQYGKYCSLKLKPEGWGSPLVQEKCQGEKACHKRQNNNNNNNNNNNYYYYYLPTIL